MPTHPATTLSTLGEFGLIQRISRKTPRPDPALLIGIGDDAAAFHPSPGCCALTTADMLLEGIHFDCSYTDPLRLGRKSLAVNLSDIAAMGGRPRCFLLCLAVPPTMSLEFIDSLTNGMLQLAAEHGVTLIGGDTCASRSGLVIAITAYGEQLPGNLIRRSGARPGDDIFVTGTVGDAALGLQLLRQGQRSGHAVERQLNPTPRVRLGTALAEAGLPTAMIDISDGLLADLGHVTRHAAVAARLRLEWLPLSTEYVRCCSRAADCYELALTGGEDYELLFTAPRERTREIIDLGVAHGTCITAIGAIASGSGIRVDKFDGSAYSVKKSGHDHFRQEEEV